MLYSLPFSATLGYLHDLDFIWLRSPNLIEICRDQIIVTEMLGMAISTVVNILSPEMVIISGEGIAAGDYRLHPMLDALRRYTFDALLDSFEVVIEPTNDQAWARGAASLVI